MEQGIYHQFEHEKINVRKIISLWKERQQFALSNYVEQIKVSKRPLFFNSPLAIAIREIECRL